MVPAVEILAHERKEPTYLMHLISSLLITYCCKKPEQKKPYYSTDLVYLEYPGHRTRRINTLARIMKSLVHNSVLSDDNKAPPYF